MYMIIYNKNSSMLLVILKIFTLLCKHGMCIAKTMSELWLRILSLQYIISNVHQMGG